MVGWCAVIRLQPGTVILDAADVDYVTRALEHLAQLMAERRDADGNPTPSQPSPRLVAFTAKLRRAVDSLPVGETAADHAQGVEPSVQPADARASKHVPVHGGRHEYGTGDAARILGISPSGVRDLARRGRLPARHTGTRWVYPARTVDAEAERRAARLVG